MRLDPFVGAFVAAIGLTIGGGLAQPASCPSSPVATISDPSLPADVCIPTGFAGNPIAFFDDFSWRAFIAMVWPAKTTPRGVPDTTVTLSGPGPRVFETFKADWEVFQPGGAAPSPWESFAGSNPCGTASPGIVDLMLGAFDKSANLGQAGAGNLVGPLVAQNRTYVRFLTGFNQIEFTKILGDKLYLQANLNNVTFGNGAADVKSAWVDMAGIVHPERYYRRTAILMDPATGSCAPKEVGLVGLHIVVKTPTRPQWIWSSFEQVDTVPPAVSGAPGTFAFHDATAQTMPDNNPYLLNPLALPTPPAFNVDRVKPIHTSTQDTNGRYRTALAAAGSVWQFYQLVMTQWPLKASTPQTPGTITNTFPGAGTDGTSFANTTMETFDQDNVRKGCMNCHTLTKQDSDFVWSLAVNAFSPPVVTGRVKPRTSIQELRKLLERTRSKRSRK